MWHPLLIPFVKPRCPPWCELVVLSFELATSSVAQAMFSVLIYQCVDACCLRATLSYVCDVLDYSPVEGRARRCAGFGRGIEAVHGRGRSASISCRRAHHVEACHFDLDSPAGKPVFLRCIRLEEMNPISVENMYRLSCVIVIYFTPSFLEVK